MKNVSYLKYAMALIIVLATIVIVCTWLKPAEEQIPVITPVRESGTNAVNHKVPASVETVTFTAKPRSVSTTNK